MVPIYLFMLCLLSLLNKQPVTRSARRSQQQRVTSLKVFHVLHLCIYIYIFQVSTNFRYNHKQSASEFNNQTAPFIVLLQVFPSLPVSKSQHFTNIMSCPQLDYCYFCSTPCAHAVKLRAEERKKGVHKDSH